MSERAGVSAGDLASVVDAGQAGMITLRGDLSDPALMAAVQAAVGVAVPGQRQITLSAETGAAWMSPDELLLLTPYEGAGAVVAGLNAALTGAGVHSLVVDVSDARAAFRVEGAGAREVLAKLAPVDFSPEAFGPGHIRRSRLAQVPAAFWMSGEDEFTVIVFRSVAEYARDLLQIAALPGGEVGYFSG